MFSDDPRDLAKTLGEMEREARVRSNFNQPDAKETMKRWLSSDRRFDTFDADRLIERTLEARSCGRTLDLDDPFLQRGGNKRPLSF
jgi:hypothetical protein